MASANKKVVIVGGVAGGANVAARLRRLDEYCEITVHERGGYVSFANCGLPYHIGNEIERREKLLVHTPESLRRRFAIDVRVYSEVLAIDREKKEVSSKDLQTGQIKIEPYDVLVLSPDASPLRPPIPGLDLPGIFSLRDMRDMDTIIAKLNEKSPKNILVVGGGFIGLEMVEQLHLRFKQSAPEIHLLEAGPHVLPPLDGEMVVQVEQELEKNGIKLHLDDPLTAFEAEGERITAVTKSGKRYSADFVLFNIGVRPETGLAVKAGLELGARGGIKVDSQMRTSDPSIFALGDCIETKNLVTNEMGVIPLAGPANRQGRIVADVIAGRESRYKGTLGTAIVRVFGLTAAATGANEKTLRRLNIPYQAVYLHPSSHAGYYPGAKPIHLKLLFDPANGKILGAQGVGADGVDKRIDLFATAIYAGLSAEQLTELELCYAPPFGSAKDPVNQAGMVAQNVIEDLVQTISPTELADLYSSTAKSNNGVEDIVLLDVRDAGERTGGSIPDSVHIPLPEIRNRLSEIPKDKLVVVFCQSGQRSYIACRILLQHGIKCKNLTGAYKTWKAASEGAVAGQAK